MAFRRLIRGLVALAMVVAAVGGLLAVPRPASAAPVFSDGFESGNLASWTSVSGLTVQQEVVATGTWAALAKGSGTASSAWRSFGSNFSELYARARFRVVSQSTDVWVVSFRRPNGAPIALVGLNAAGNLIVRNNFTGVTSTSTIVVGTGAWHEVDLHVRVGASGRLDVTYDGAPVPALSADGNLGPAQIGRVLIGEANTGRTYEVAIDDVDVATSRVVDTTPPSAPTNLAATASGSAQIGLTWTAAFDDVGVASYTIYRSTGGAPFAAVGSTAATSFVDTGLTPATTYDYVVDAVDGAGNRSAPSDPASAQTGDMPPNVVVILSDDQPWDTLGAMSTLQSELVAKGMSFTTSIVTDPLCCPSRTSSLRGQYDHTTGIYDVKVPLGGAGLVAQLGLESSMLPTWLDAAGYRTGLVGKYLNNLNLTHVPPGWDYWRASAPNYFNYRLSEQGVVRTYGSAEADYNTLVLTGYADEFIRTTDPNTPLFLWLAPNAPHSPYTPEPKYANDARCSSATTLDEPSFNEADVSDKPAYLRATPPLSTPGITNLGTTVPRSQCRMLLSVDDMVGTVLEALAETGRLAETFIVYTSDNGLQRGEHRLGGKEAPYENSIRVPLVIRYDPITGGVPSSAPELVANIDIAPTIVDLLDLTVTPGCPNPPYGGVCSGQFDGVSLLPLLDGSAPAWRDGVLIEHIPALSSLPAYCALRTQSHTFVRYTTGEEELYDLAADPWQLVNLLGDGSVTPSEQALRDDLFGRLFGGGGLCSPAPPNYSLP